jgi:guanyl-specific ribonuclease Sa
MKKKYSVLIALVLALVLGFFGINLELPTEVPDTTPFVSTSPTEIAPSSVATEPETSPTTEAAEPEATTLPPETTVPTVTTEDTTPYLDPDGTYTTKEDVALYIYLYGELPQNFMTKQEARKLGWEGGGLERYAPGMCIGGDRFGNYEGILPDAPGRKWTECDIDTLGAKSRGAKRIVFSNDGLIYYTDDHYETFDLLYGEE